MRHILTIFKREINAYFNSAIAYIFIIVFALISCGLFMTGFFIVGSADMRGFFSLLPLILCIFLPAVSMRLWAEDKKGNTLELLLTFPMKTRELALGKFLASFIFYLIALLATLPIPIMVSILGNPDIGSIISGYIGLLCIGSFFLALGIFLSGLCKDQIVAFVLSMMACFGFFLLGTDFAISSIDGWMSGVGTFFKNALGMTQHFIPFEKGIIDNRDLVYFLIGTAIFLILNGFWFEGRLRPKAKTIFTTACFVSTGIFMLINLTLADLPIGRYDVTEDKIHTISEATGSILTGLKTPVIVKLFISSSDKMPTGLKTLERDVRDKLEEFKITSKGNFKYKVFRMDTANVMEQEPGDEETLEKSIQKKGIVPFQVQSVEADEVGVKLIYSAISVAYKEKEDEVIPRVTPESVAELEYILISKIYKMTLEKAPKVAMFAPYEERTISPEMMRRINPQQQRDTILEDAYEIIPKVLGYEGYEVSRTGLTKDDPIPENIDTLIVIEPKSLNERQRFEINRFLVNGGSVFLVVQQYSFNYTPEAGGLQVVLMDNKPDANPLLNAWGLGVDEDILMDKEHDVITVAGMQPFGGISMQMSYPVRSPLHIKVLPEQMDKEISITSNLSSILYLWGNALQIDKDKLIELGLDIDVLFTSSQDSWKIPFQGDIQGRIQVLDKEDFIMPVSEKRHSFPLAILVEGQFPNAFSGKDMPAWPKDETEEGEESYEKSEKSPAISPAPGKLILIGCSMIFNKQAIGRPGHIDFLLNSIDAITLGEDLIKVRSKRPQERVLGRLSARAKIGWRIFTTFLVPLILCILGGVRLFTRSRLKLSYLKNI